MDASLKKLREIYKGVLKRRLYMLNVEYTISQGDDEAIRAALMTERDGVMNALLILEEADLKDKVEAA